MSFALRFEHVSKRYRGGGYGSLRDDIVGGRRARRRATIDALDDVSFEIKEGESFGIVGLNGAGKTTSLKLATRITYPTEGRISVRGRIGALIEVGTGMHPELTGRENVQLYGRILGHSRGEISRRFDAIVDFSGIEAAIDQPVKQYSSGMQLRLGFSVALHLDPDVFLVDEAIAVGDASFQYKCIERMSTFVREGRTLVFVSHDMVAVETLCRRAVLLDGGRVALDGSAREVVGAYLGAVHAARLDTASPQTIVSDVTSPLRITEVKLEASDGEEARSVKSGGSVTVRLKYVADEPLHQVAATVAVSDGRFGAIGMVSMLDDQEGPVDVEGSGELVCTLHRLPLQPRTYEVWGEVGVRREFGYVALVPWQRLLLLKVTGDLAGEGAGAVAVSLNAPLTLDHRWDHLPTPGP